MTAQVSTDATATAQAEGPDPPAASGAGHAIARNTAIFSLATGVSRVAGLVREVVAASYFGTSGAASAFTIAFQVPNLVRALFADAALSAAFVPVFTELLEQGRRREAFNARGLAALRDRRGPRGADGGLRPRGRASSCRCSRATSSPRRSWT